MRGRKERPLHGDGRMSSPLGATVRAWRQHRGMSVTALAVAAGFGEQGRGYVSKLEHGDIKRPEKKKLESIAAALGIDVGHLQQHQLPPAADLTADTVVPDGDMVPSPRPSQGQRPIAASGTFGSSGVVVDAGGAELDDQSLGEQIERLLDEAALPYGEWHLARRLILAHARAVCETLRLSILE